GGFTSGLPWLPVAPEHLRQSVATQETEPAALLHHYRKALAFRRTHPALTKGDITPMDVAGSVLSFQRSHTNETIFCAFNLSDEPGTIDVPDGDWATIGAELGSIAPGPDYKLHLGPWQATIALKKA
ncbi:MAG: DUF3459 domain-containing protein, partial [Pseudomonadota bacterium]